MRLSFWKIVSIDSWAQLYLTFVGAAFFFDIIHFLSRPSLLTIQAVVLTFFLGWLLWQRVSLIQRVWVQGEQYSAKVLNSFPHRSSRRYRLVFTLKDGQSVERDAMITVAKQYQKGDSVTALIVPDRPKEVWIKEAFE